MSKRAAKPAPKAADAGNNQGVGYKHPPIATRFKKGQSGNPHGRPKSFDALRKLAQEIVNEPLAETGLTRLQAMLTRMTTSANPADRRLVLEYGFGKVKDELDVGSDSEHPITIRVEYADDQPAAPASGAADDQA